MALWTVCLVFLATAQQRHEGAHQVTYWLHHVVAIPGVVAIGSVMLRDMIRSGRTLLTFWLWTGAAAIGTLFLVVNEHENRSTLSVYMVETATGDAAVVDEQNLRAFWMQVRTNPGFAKLQPADTEKHQAAVKALKAVTDRPAALSNGMDWACDVFTFVAAFLMIVFGAVVPIIAIRNAFNAQANYKPRVIVSLALALSWIPLRIYADFHEQRIQKLSEDVFDPYTALGIIIMLAIVGLVIFRYGVAGVGVTLKEYATVGGAFVSCVGTVIPSVIRNEPFLWIEQFLSGPGDIVVFGGIVVAAVTGWLSLEISRSY